jgi:hypothetical protein
MQDIDALHEPGAPGDDEPDDGEQKTGEVVALDSFRKKKT